VSGAQGGTAARSALGGIAAAVLGVLMLASVAVSTSGPMIAALAAPSLAIAFWRNAFGAAVTAGAISTRAAFRAEFRALTRRQIAVIAAAGVLLAAHFACWTPSVNYTTVASATALVCAQPVWTAMGARLVGRTVSRATWTGIGIALAAVVLLTGSDLAVSGRALQGDLLALVAGALAAAYTGAGEVARRTVSTGVYTSICYGVCALTLLVAALGGRVQLTGFDTEVWLRIAALTITAQLLGHTLFNRVVGRVGATVVATGGLFEVPGAAFIAAIFLPQPPPASAIPAGILLLVGVFLVVRAEGARLAAHALPVD